jgi:hypothetical protein
MPVSINNTTLTFNDATTQTTAGLVAGGALGTPASGTLTNCTSIPVNQATGTLPVANGGTGSTSLTANRVLLGNGTSGLQEVAPSTNGNVLTSNGTTWVSQAPAGGGVTSAVAGNGISVSGATGAVTFAVACPTFNTVGSYAQVMISADYGGTQSVSSGSNYSAGVNQNQLSSSSCAGSSDWNNTNNLSGTWKWMGNSRTENGRIMAIACRVS